MSPEFMPIIHKKLGDESGQLLPVELSMPASKCEKNAVVGKSIISQTSQ